MAALLPLGSPALRQPTAAEFRAASRPHLTDYFAYWRACRTRAANLGADRAKQLPFNPCPLVRNYLYNAYPLGILMAERTFPTALLPFYLQLHFPGSRLTEAGSGEQCRFFPQMGIYEFRAIGALELEEITAEIETDADGVRIATSFTERMAVGSYLYLRANEFFIPQTKAHRRWHFRHALLLHGFRRGGDEFLGTTYVRDGSFAPIRIPLALLREAILSPRGRIPDAYNSATFAATLRPKTLAEAGAASRKLIVGALVDYLNAEVSAGWIDRLVNQYPAYAAQFALRDQVRAPGFWGRNFNQALKQHVADSIRHNLAVDLTATKTLWEHKCTLQFAFSRALAPGIAANPQISRRLEELCTLAHGIHLAAYSNRNGRGLAATIIDRISALDALEAEVLPQMIAAYPIDN